MIAYIRIPKTASCTVLEALKGTGVVSVDHEPISAYSNAAATFTIIRDPWERLFSWYRHSKMFQHRTFEDYVLNWATEQFYRHGNADQTDMLVADQSAWWRGRQPTFIGRFENLEVDLTCIGNLLGFEPNKVQHLNVSLDTPAHPYSPDVWTLEMIEKMDHLFADFARGFGYEAPCS